MSKIDYQHIMQFQRQVEEERLFINLILMMIMVIFLEHGLVYLIDNEALISKASKKNAACVLTGPVIINAPNLILKVPIGMLGSSSSKV